MFYSCDFPILAPPNYPQVLDVYVHARWRMPRLPDHLARGTEVQQWAQKGARPEDYTRWAESLSAMGQTMLWPEDPGMSRTDAFQRDARIVYDRGLRSAYFMPRMKQTPRVAWSSYKRKRLFNAQMAPRLNDVQIAAAHQMIILRAVDVAIHEHDHIVDQHGPLAGAKIKLIHIRGLPETAFTEPDIDRHAVAHATWLVTKNKLAHYHAAWRVRCSECASNRNPAAFLSGCYMAPLVTSPHRSGSHPYSLVGLEDDDEGINEVLKDLGRCTVAGDLAAIDKLCNDLKQIVRERPTLGAALSEEDDDDVETPVSLPERPQEPGEEREEGGRAQAPAAHLAGRLR